MSSGWRHNRLISALHMVPAEGVPDADWDSFWAKLTFDLGVPAASPKNSQP